MATVASGVVVVTVVPGAETVLAEGTLLLEGGVSAGSRVKIAFRLKGCTPHFLKPATILEVVSARIHATENT